LEDPLDFASPHPLVVTTLEISGSRNSEVSGSIPVHCKQHCTNC